MNYCTPQSTYEKANIHISWVKIIDVGPFPGAESYFISECMRMRAHLRTYTHTLMHIRIYAHALKVKYEYISCVHL